MNFVVRHIEYLLRTGDGCVVIPGIGALLARRSPARFDASAGCYVPPSTVYAFNGMLRDSDGLLVSSIARKEDISFDQAARRVDDFVTSVRSNLRSGRPVALGRIGSLVMSDGNMVFMPLEAKTPASWLCPVAMRPLVAAPVVRIESEEHEADEFAETIRDAWRRTAIRIGRVAASVAVVVAVGFAVANFLGRTAPVAQRASLGLEFSSPAKENSGLLNRPGTSSSPLVLVLRNFDDAATVVDTMAMAVADKTEHHAMPAAHTGNGAYVYVVASLGSREEAERYMKRHKGDLRVLSSESGRYRVYAASASSSASLRDKIRTLGMEDSFPGAWICRGN
ncbi:MAG: hypothetical protein K2L96_08190 [Muribaculaceae bacterium]|nr:hypothetical protein [Muribaculaceae bacterium]